MAFVFVVCLFAFVAFATVIPAILFVAYATYRKTGGKLSFVAWLRAMGIIW